MQSSTTQVLVPPVLVNKVAVTQLHARSALAVGRTAAVSAQVPKHRPRNLLIWHVHRRAAAGGRKAKARRGVVVRPALHVWRHPVLQHPQAREVLGIGVGLHRKEVQAPGGGGASDRKGRGGEGVDARGLWQCRRLLRPSANLPTLRARTAAAAAPRPPHLVPSLASSQPCASSMLSGLALQPP